MTARSLMVPADIQRGHAVSDDRPSEPRDALSVRSNATRDRVEPLRGSGGVPCFGTQGAPSATLGWVVYPLRGEGTRCNHSFRGRWNEHTECKGCLGRFVSDFLAVVINGHSVDI